MYDIPVQPRGQDYNEKHKLDLKQYEVTSFLSTDCELSTETCSKNVYVLALDLLQCISPLRKILKAVCSENVSLDC